MNKAKKYIWKKKAESINKIKRYKYWIKEEEKHLHYLNQCLQQFEQEDLK